MKRPLVYINKKKVTQQKGGGVVYRNFGLAPVIPSDSYFVGRTGVVGYDQRNIEGSIVNGWVILQSSLYSRYGQAFPFNATLQDIIDRYDYIGKFYKRIGVTPMANFRVNADTTFYVICETSYLEAGGKENTKGLLPYKYTLQDSAYHFTYFTENDSFSDYNLRKLQLGNADDRDVSRETHPNAEAFINLFNRIKNYVYPDVGYRYENDKWVEDSSIRCSSPRRMTLGQSMIVFVTDQPLFGPDVIFDDKAYSSWKLLPVQEITL